MVPIVAFWKPCHTRLFAPYMRLEREFLLVHFHDMITRGICSNVPSVDHCRISEALERRNHDLDDAVGTRLVLDAELLEIRLARPLDLSRFTEVRGGRVQRHRLLPVTVTLLRRCLAYRSNPLGWQLIMFPIVIGLLHQEEAVYESHGIPDSTPVQRPLPALTNVDETTQHGRELAAEGERPAVPGHVFAALVGEPDVGDGNLTKGFDGGAKEAEDDTVGEIGTWLLAQGGRGQDDDGGKEGEEVDGSFAILKGHGLPEDTAPAVEEELFTSVSLNS